MRPSGNQDIQSPIYDLIKFLSGNAKFVEY